MCGITGQFSVKGLICRKRFISATDKLSHRGPDGFGHYFSENGEIALGHRRLSFLDLSPAGKQPFISNDGTVIVTLNGEIYNYKELKQELSNSYSFITHSDTEVLIASYLKWGIDCLKHIRGMFAFGLYDSRIRKVFLVRDRFGIKPLYYYCGPDGLAFASELKALVKLCPDQRSLDFSSMVDFFVYRYVPSPKSIWKNLKKLEPAHYLEFELSQTSSSLVEYWKAPVGSMKKSPNDLARVAKEIVQESVREHLRADVPIGSFLSGGYDSSALVYFMKLSKANPQTFSVGFDGWENSEHVYAKVVSNHLGVQNESVMLNESSLGLITQMPNVYDEPIADISILPTYAVSKLASKSVKAVFSGEGADELFGGYTWQHEFYKLCYPNNLSKKIKVLFKQPDVISHYIKSMSMGLFDHYELQKMFQPEYHQFIPNDIHWFYRKHLREGFNNVKSVQYLDMKTFMAELVLTKVDRASMANSLEVRVPFLDHRLFECVFTSNEKSYLNPQQTKYILNQMIHKQLPETILNRKKQGFVGPDSYYMNKQWYRRELHKSSLVADGIIRQSYINSLLKEEYSWKLWKVLVMEKWYQVWG